MENRRTEPLLDALSGIGAQGMLVHNRSNMRWLSGYTGEGLILIAKGLRAIVTDFRYTEQAEKEAPAFSVHMTSQTKLHDAVAFELVQGAGIQTLAFEDGVVTVKQLKALEAAMPGIAFVSAERKIEALREIKDEGEIALIEKACGIASEAFAKVLPLIHVGMTELEVRLALETCLYQLGAEKTSFDTIVASGENGALPHAVPGTRRIQKGDLVTMDFGARVGGYCSDITRTIAVGEIDDEKRRVYDTVLQAQLMALDAIRPGASCREVDRIARDHIEGAGYVGRFGHGLGHAVGIDIHENPRFNTISEATLKAGMVITDEPGIYLPGQCGCRIEDTVLVTEDGVRRLTTAPKELIIL